jgi:predicted glycosyltransferase
MMDYEYTETRIFNRYADEILVPAMIPDERLSKNGIQLSKVTRYNGFKEELYLASFKPDLGFRKSLGINEDETLAVIRPPGMLGNYHDERSEELLIYALNHLSVNINCRVLVSSRSQKDRDLINFHIKDKQNIRFLEKAVDGLQLVNAADIVVSGGGTMNRESALLGTKTYSIFTGRRPYLDELLEKEGRLKFISSKEEIDEIDLEKASVKEPYSFNKNIVKEITDIIANRATIGAGKHSTG